MSAIVLGLYQGKNILNRSVVDMKPAQYLQHDYAHDIPVVSFQREIAILMHLYI